MENLQVLVISMVFWFFHYTDLESSSLRSTHADSFWLRFACFAWSFHGRWKNSKINEIGGIRIDVMKFIPDKWKRRNADNEQKWMEGTRRLQKKCGVMGWLLMIHEKDWWRIKLNHGRSRERVSDTTRVVLFIKYEGSEYNSIQQVFERQSLAQAAYSNQWDREGD